MPNSNTRGPHLFATDRYEDITPDVRAQAAALGQGGIKQAPGARMFDNLSAFQIGVAKLDTGSPKEFRLLDAEIAQASAQFSLTSDANMTQFADALKCAEMAWHTGYAGLQTVMANLLVQKELQQFTQRRLSMFNTELLRVPSEWTPPDLIKAYIWSAIKAMALAMDIVERDGSGVVFPEEDFHLLQYDMYFLDDTPVQRVIEMLEQARKAAVALKFVAFADRLGAQATWLTVLNQKIPKKVVNVNKMIEVVERWEPVSLAPLARVWFSDGAQARINHVTLRHPLISTTPDEARTQWLRILRAIVDIAPILTVQRSSDLLGSLLSFSSRQEPAVVRAMVKARFSETQALGQATRHWAALDVRETAAQGTLIDAHRNVLDPFLAQASLAYADLLAAFTMNRCHLREALSGLAITFDSLQVAAVEADAQLSAAAGTQTNMLNDWTMMRKLQIMVWTVLLAVETEVVSYPEWTWIYAYAQQLCQHLLVVIRHMRAQHEAVAGGRQQLGFMFLSALELESQMLEQICLAELLVWMAVHRMKAPKPALNVSRATQYRLRFRMFDSVGVPDLPKLSEHDEFVAGWDVPTALKGAANSARTALSLLTTVKEMAEGNPELGLLQRSAMGLSVCVARLVKASERPTGVRTVSEGYHPYFPVVELEYADGESK